ncbi:hypothetical protein [Bradyrhizobium sacchari]|nr:hypothetical protein [Bradyrhizobium sacchari]
MTAALLSLATPGSAPGPLRPHVAVDPQRHAPDGEQRQPSLRAVWAWSS